jgi:hypothetical protein
MLFEMSTRDRARVAARRLKADGFTAIAPRPRSTGEHTVKVDAGDREAPHVLDILRRVDPNARPMN